jgi:hypothetical protein
MMEGVNLLIELLLHQFKFGLISKYFEGVVIARINRIMNIELFALAVNILQGLILLEQCLTHERYQILAVLI